MKVICVDDERLLMEGVTSLCLELPQVKEAKGFTTGRDALDYLSKNQADIAILDIDMPGMNGIELAARIKSSWPEMAVIFLTGYSQYAVEAFSVRASGYLLKPVSKERLSADIEYVLSQNPRKRKERIFIQTFGNFDVYVDDRPVSFRMSRCKELLAYLVDKRGSGVTRPEAFAALWEDRLYDRGMQKQLDVVIRLLRSTLKEHDIGEILEMQKGTLRVKPDTFSCDAYLFFDGDVDSINAFRGEYMSAYSWASFTESMIARRWGG